jgi:hypothetical protein
VLWDGNGIGIGIGIEVWNSRSIDILNQESKKGDRKYVV